MNRHMSVTLVGKSMALMAYTLDDRGITPLLLTQKLRYSVSVRPKNEFSAFTFNPASASFCRNFSSAFRWSANSSLVIVITLLMYAHTISNPSKSSDISLEIYPVCYIHQWECFGTHNSPKGVQYYRAVLVWEIIISDNSAL